MSNIRAIPRCRVCGQHITGVGDGEAFGAFGKVLFVTHAGSCAERARGAIRVVGTTAVKGLGALLAKKYPAVFGAFQVVTQAMKQESR